MARYPVEESLLREPNLWVPRKKPVGPAVKIDRQNPLTKGLTSLILTDQHNSSRDLISNVLPTVFTSSYAARSEGMVVENSDNTEQIIYIDAPQYKLGSNPWTIWWRGYINASGRALISRRSAGSNGCWWSWCDTSINFAIFAGGGFREGFAADNDFDGAGEYSVIISYLGGNNFKKFTNNIRYTLYDAGLIPTGYGTHTFNLIGLGSGTTGGLDGGMYVSGIWERALTDEECEQLYFDPYGFLIPA